jgi:hypothetical protein
LVEINEEFKGALCSFCIAATKDLLPLAFSGLIVTKGDGTFADCQSQQTQDRVNLSAFARQSYC